MSAFGRATTRELISDWWRIALSAPTDSLQNPAFTPSHFASTIEAAFSEVVVRHVRVLSRLVFTEDGRKPFDDPAKMHRLRRSFAKTWRNARWRDMLLAFLQWLAEGKNALSVPLSSEENLVLALPPISWMAPVSLPVQAEAPEPDEDDPSDDDDEIDTSERDDGTGASGDSANDL
jgi:hypothetical protein